MRRLTCFVALALTAAAAVAQEGAPAFNQWRGPQRDGHVCGFPAPERWPNALTRVWKVPVGEGHASPIATAESAFVFTREGDNEVIRRLRLATGEPVWRASYPAPYEMNAATRAHGKGPKSTPTLAEGRLYTLGISGILSCLNAASGEEVWRHDFSREFAKSSPLYGAAMSPLVTDGLLIAHVGGHDDGALIAFDAATGDPRWRWSGDGPAYASPIAVEIGGVRQIVTQTQRQIVGIALLDGSLLWSVPFTTPYDQNCVTPVLAGELLVFGGMQQPTLALRVRHQDRWTVERVWETRDATFYMSTPVAVGRWLYGMSERRSGQLVAIDAASGKVEWAGEGRFGDNAALLDVGGALLALRTNADLAVFRTGGATLEEIARYQVADGSTWASPAIVGRSILVKDVDSLYRWDLPR